MHLSSQRKGCGSQPQTATPGRRSTAPPNGFHVQSAHMRAPGIGCFPEGVEDRQVNQGHEKDPVLALTLKKKSQCFCWISWQSDPPSPKTQLLSVSSVPCLPLTDRATPMNKCRQYFTVCVCHMCSEKAYLHPRNEPPQCGPGSPMPVPDRSYIVPSSLELLQTKDI